MSPLFVADVTKWFFSVNKKFIIDLFESLIFQRTASAVHVKNTCICNCDRVIDWVGWLGIFHLLCLMVVCHRFFALTPKVQYLPGFLDIFHIFIKKVIGIFILCPIGECGLQIFGFFTISSIYYFVNLV